MRQPLGLTLQYQAQDLLRILRQVVAQVVGKAAHRPVLVVRVAEGKELTRQGEVAVQVT
jgi:hypothetical protein